MSTPDGDDDPGMTADWPRIQPGPAADDGEATTVVPKMPQRQATPPHAGQWDPRWQTAPGPYPPVVPTPSKRPRWGLLAVGAVALVVIAVAVTVFVTRSGDSSTPTATRSTSAAAQTATTSTPSTTAAAIVDPTALKGLLASVADVTQLTDNAAMTPMTIENSPVYNALADPDRCTSAVTPATFTAYNGSTFTGIVVQALTNEQQHIAVVQAIASFPSDVDATAFVEKEFVSWQACMGTDFTLDTGSGDPQPGKVSTSASTLGINTVLILPQSDDPTRQCRHAMSARKNLVVDVRVCAPTVGSMGWNLDQVIGDKITAH